MSSPGISYVPCLSCQNGYAGKHECEAPDYCPCDRPKNHIDQEVGHVTRTNPSGSVRQCEQRVLHGGHEWQAEFGSYFNAFCPGNLPELKYACTRGDFETDDRSEIKNHAAVLGHFGWVEQTSFTEEDKAEKVDTGIQEGDVVVLRAKVARANSEQAFIEFTSMEGPFSVRVPIGELLRVSG